MFDILVFKQEVTILILIDGFLQCHYRVRSGFIIQKVTILILIDGFLQLKMKCILETEQTVTILILIDGFLQ